jgi:hypothetical protein
MSITPIVQVLQNGPRNYAVRLACELTGGDTEYQVEKIALPFAASTQNDNLPPCTDLLLEGFLAATTNIWVCLFWEGVPSSTLWSFPPNHADTQKFRNIGGIKNNATRPSGCVLLSADTYTDPQLDGRYDITLWFKKRYALGYSGA